MRQNVGLVLLTGGSILLALGVFRFYLIEFMKFLDWKNVPWESRLVLRLFGVKQDNFIKRIVKAHEKYPLGKELKDLTLAERLYLNIPVYAVIFMVIGFFLSLNYSAIGRFGRSMVITKTLLTIIGCSVTVLGIVCRQLGNRVRGYDEFGKPIKWKLRPAEEREGRDAKGTRIFKLSWWFLTLGPVIQLIAAVMK